MKQLTIIGSGTASLLVLICLKNNKINPKQITIIDPYFDGGDLKRKWYSVRSNTVWKQILDSVPPSEFSDKYKNLNPETPCELHLIIEYLMEQVKPFLNQCILRTGTVTSINKETKENKQWSITMSSSLIPIISDVLILTQGAEPKTMDLSIPSIPLEIALDSQLIKRYISQDDHVIVFGTAHSGTLVLLNLAQNNIQTSAFYKSNTNKPFLFARDGEYVGIKQDSAIIADDITNGKYPSIQLYSLNDVSSLIHVSKLATKVVYAIGFQARNIMANINLNEYNGNSGRIKETDTAWGFGSAYPSLAEDGIHWDIGVPSFMEHIQKQIPDIVYLLE